MSRTETLNAIDRLVDLWSGPVEAGMYLHEWLDMTVDQYVAWIERDEVPEGYRVPDRREAECVNNTYKDKTTSL